MRNRSATFRSPPAWWPGRQRPFRTSPRSRPCSALDPIATRKIEELMRELRQRFTIAIVTHNLQQAQRVADYTGFLYVDTNQGGRTGYLVEFGESHQIFANPVHTHTQQYIRGEFS